MIIDAITKTVDISNGESFEVRCKDIEISIKGHEGEFYIFFRKLSTLGINFRKDGRGIHTIEKDVHHITIKK